MGRKLNGNFVLQVLSKKGVVIEKGVSGDYVIDLSNAKDLGNKSWGYIDFLSRSMAVIGYSDYAKKNFHISTGEDKQYKKKKEVLISQSETKTHSYQGLLPYYKYGNTKMYCSEFTHMLELNHTQTKFNRQIFHKPVAERKAMNKARMKDNCLPFENRVMIQLTSNNDNPTHIINQNH